MRLAHHWLMLFGSPAANVEHRRRLSQTWPPAESVQRGCGAGAGSQDGKGGQQFGTQNELRTSHKISPCCGLLECVSNVADINILAQSKVLSSSRLYGVIK